MYFTFLSSSPNILTVVPFKRSISWFANPNDFTSSIFLRDSVVDPANAVVSETIVFCIFLMRLLSTELRKPNIGITSINIGAMIQCTLIA
ncbi:hypothetical protein D3C78_1340120 [compost metagenome]